MDFSYPDWRCFIKSDNTLKRVEASIIHRKSDLVIIMDAVTLLDNESFWIFPVDIAKQYYIKYEQVDIRESIEQTMLNKKQTELAAFAKSHCYEIKCSDTKGLAKEHIRKIAPLQQTDSSEKNPPTTFSMERLHGKVQTIYIENIKKIEERRVIDQKRVCDTDECEFVQGGTYIFNTKRVRNLNPKNGKMYDGHTNTIDADLEDLDATTYIDHNMMFTDMMLSKMLNYYVRKTVDSKKGFLSWYVFDTFIAQFLIKDRNSTACDSYGFDSVENKSHFLDRDVILFPFHYGANMNGHWALHMVYRPYGNSTKPLLYIIDSLHNTDNTDNNFIPINDHVRIANCFLNFLFRRGRREKTPLRPSHGIKLLSCDQQGSTSACGMFVAGFVNNIIKSRDFIDNEIEKNNETPHLKAPLLKDMKDIVTGFIAKIKKN